VLGLGLIGGSVARAAVAAGMDVSAWTPSGDGPAAAIADGIQPRPSIEAAIATSELVVLAAPPLACLELIDALGGRLAGALAAGAVVTDVASTKTVIVERARAAGLRFVGGHPMAGREASGYAASDPKLLNGRPWVIVPPDPPDSDAETRLVALVSAAGATPVRMSAAEHDRAVATISHLPLVVAAALAEMAAATPDWSTAASLAAGGWASMTRLARGDIEMGTGILATNGPEIVGRLRTLRTVLDSWLVDLEADSSAAGAGSVGGEPAGPTPTLRRRLAAARALLEAADR
jgi:prephenate dehydrogenase